jgi:hypothetical protein
VELSQSRRDKPAYALNAFFDAFQHRAAPLSVDRWDYSVILPV